MTFTDPLSDMLTRIRNGQQARKSYVASPVSSLRIAVLDVLKREGCIRGYAIETPDQAGYNKHDQVRIELKYDENNKPVIKEIKRESTPGKRHYTAIKSLLKKYNGLGFYILSTPKGVMTDHEARVAGVGGEVLCSVF